MTLGAIEVYLFEVAIFMSTLYIFNKLLLGGDTHHHLNRHLWLLTILIPFVLPLFVGIYDGGVTASRSLVEQRLHDDGLLLGDGAAEVSSSVVSRYQIVLIAFIIYICGVVVVSIHTATLYASLFRLVWCSPYDIERSTNIVDRELLSRFRGYEAELGVRGRVRYIIHDMDLLPFSWFGYVVISRSNVEEESCREIILHEISHIKYRHTFDLVVANIMIIVLWFNPSSWLVRRALQQVHEYCCDELLLNRGVSAKKYQLLLIKKSVGSQLQSISNTLNHSNLKNRITMMLKKKSSKMATAKCLYAIPLLLFVTMLLSSPVATHAKDTVKESEPKVTNNSDNSSENESKKEDEDTPFLAIENMPKFNDGDLNTFHKWCMERIQYPQAAHEKSIEGRVIASFWVTKTGGISNIVIIESPDELLSQEVIRVINSSPKWTPGTQRGEAVNVKYTVPILFSLK